MGSTCGGMSAAFTIDELVDLNIGDTKEMAYGCGPSISGNQGGSGYDWLTKRGLSWPQNGEFTWGGLGSGCAMCSNIDNGYGCDCEGGIGGQRGKVQRTSFQGNPTQCCIQQKNVINNTTCDPQYRSYTSTGCDTPMLAYCKAGNWSTSACRSWVQEAVNNNRTVANVELNNYCKQGLNFKKQECQDWCGLVRNQPSMASACDSTVLTYCQNNPTDPLCACMMPPLNVTQIQDLITTAKVCWYKPCQLLTNDNYITSVMADQKRNCVSTACLIEAGDISINGTDNSISFSNSCAVDLLKPGVTGVTGPTGTTGPTGQTGTTNPLENISQYFPYIAGSSLVSVVIFIFVMILLFVLPGLFR